MRRAVRALGLASMTTIGALALVGCSDDQAGPLGHGDTLTVDVDAASEPMQSANDDGTADEDASDDSPFAPLDGPYGALPDGYAPIALCDQCACDAGAYCFGGAPGMTLSSCDQTASTGLDLGCHTIPPGCAAEPDCVCLLQALGSEMPCVAVCETAVGGGFTVYCPP